MINIFAHLIINNQSIHNTIHKHPNICNTHFTNYPIKYSFIFKYRINYQHSCATPPSPEPSLSSTRVPPGPQLPPFSSATWKYEIVPGTVFQSLFWSRVFHRWNPELRCSYPHITLPRSLLNPHRNCSPRYRLHLPIPNFDDPFLLTEYPQLSTQHSF